MKCFGYALRGFAAAFRRERNLRFHCAAAFHVILLGALCRLPAWSWAAALVCCALVIGAELLNTALESLCDEVTREYSEKIRLAKDAAAAAVLVCAVFSAAVGLAVFIPRLGGAARTLAAHPALWAAIAASLAVWIKLVFLSWRTKE